MIISIELVQKRVMHGKHAQRHYNRYPKSPLWAVVMYIDTCAQPLTVRFRIGTLPAFAGMAALHLYPCMPAFYFYTRQALFT